MGRARRAGGQDDEPAGGGRHHPSKTEKVSSSLDQWPELGTLQHCRDNVTMFSGYNVVSYCILAIGCDYSI